MVTVPLSIYPKSTSPNLDERPEFFKKAWIISQIFTLVMFLICLGSIAAFYIYGSRTGRWNTSKRQQFTLMLLAIITPIITLLRLISTQIVIIIGLVSEVNQRGDVVCQVSMDLSVVLYTFSNLPT